MKKIYSFILLFVFTLFLTSCGSKMVNEIYNVTFEGTIDVEGFEDLTQSVIKSTESSIVTVLNYDVMFGGLDSNGTGSGVVYQSNAVLKNGQIVDAKTAIEQKLDIKTFEYRAITNEHVIEGSKIIKIVGSDNNSEITAQVIAYDKTLDLAIISFSSPKYFPAIKLGDSEKLTKGSFVIAIGSPYGLDFKGTCTFGIVSDPKRYVEEENLFDTIINEYVQHDAAINSGNSGGALVNMKGELVGINTMKLTFDGDSTEGMGFAIPSNKVKEFINENK